MKTTHSRAAKEQDTHWTVVGTSGSAANAEAATGVSEEAIDGEKSLVIRLRFDQFNDILNGFGRGAQPESVTNGSNEALLSVQAHGVKPRIDISFNQVTQEMEINIEM